MAGWGPSGPTTAYQDPGLRWAHHLDSGGQNIYAVGPKMFLTMLTSSVLSILGFLRVAL